MQKDEFSRPFLFVSQSDNRSVSQSVRWSGRSETRLAASILEETRVRLGIFLLTAVRVDGVRPPPPLKWVRVNGSPRAVLGTGHMIPSCFLFSILNFRVGFFLAFFVGIYGTPPKPLARSNLCACGTMHVYQDHPLVLLFGQQ